MEQHLTNTGLKLIWHSSAYLAVPLSGASSSPLPDPTSSCQLHSDTTNYPADNTVHGHQAHWPLARLESGSGLSSKAAGKSPGYPTLIFISREKLKDGIHGPHVEDEPQLRDTHGDKAEQQDRTEDTLHEGGRSCRRKNRVSEEGNIPTQTCTISEEALASGLAGLLLTSHTNALCQWQLKGVHSQQLPGPLQTSITNS